jgi:nucleoside-diphosphate-sugar epimerase
MASFVMGPPLVPPESPEKIHETVVDVWTVLSGGDIPKTLTYFVDVRDVARLHVFGIAHGNETNGERFIAVGGITSGQAIADILRKQYPERRSIIKVGKPGEGYPADYKTGITFDGSKAVKASGQEYIGYEKTIVDSAKAFEQLL